MENKLSEEQENVINAARNGHNIFFTGSAGVGKSYLLKSLVNELMDISPKKVAVTASTGIAAVLVNGCTLHSWAGVGLANKTQEQLEDIVRKSPACDRWRRTDVLIIDEISMVSEDLLDKLNYIGSKIRGKPLPFGGLQVILCGDFFQLPPVPSRRPCPKCGVSSQTASEKPNIVTCKYKLATGEICETEFDDSTKFAFQSKVWNQLNLQIIELTKVFRQESRDFVNILNEIRLGTVSEKTVKALRLRSVILDTSNKILPTVLYPHRRSVNAENASHFNAIQDDTHVYKAMDTYTNNGYKFRDRLDDTQADIELPLKRGTQVILISNIDVSAGLANGARGVVQEFTKVASNLHVGNEEIITEYLPVVQFACGRTQVVERYTWEMEIFPGTKITRMQLPLKHAWALTIHKSQGMTLDYVKMSLTRVFAHGQAYVALSRCRSLEGIQLDEFSVDCVKAHPEVLKFAKTYQNIQITQSRKRKRTDDIESDDDYDDALLDECVAAERRYSADNLSKGCQVHIDAVIQDYLAKIKPKGQAVNRQQDDTFRNAFIEFVNLRYHNLLQQHSDTSSDEIITNKKV